MSTRILRHADRPAVPWRNGGGLTREIASWPPGPGASGFAWRVSLAEVAADGPFSVFPGVDRVLTMVEGAGMALALADGTPRSRLVDARYAPQHFPGDVPTDCRLLDGPVVNLNVMHRRTSGLTVHVDIARGPRRRWPDGPGTTLAIPLDAPAALVGSTTTTLLPYDAVLRTDTDRGGHTGTGIRSDRATGSDANGLLECDGRLALISVRPA
ncbi:HutD/Ves family protein [Streptomyces sp. CA-294286]|uniref:HutD/Ves family protein n=1 Tax=Streptomyces sp. CA-294286 TaxID=3240070 RepID=UPI003D8D5ECF